MSGVPLDMHRIEERPHPLEGVVASDRSASRAFKDRAFLIFCIAVAMVSLAILVILLATILWQGVGNLSFGFLTRIGSDKAAEAGVGPAIGGSIWVCLVCAFTALPVGIATAIFLEEFQPVSSVGKRIHSFIQLNISNLAGVPSVVYGILGLTLFVSMGGWFDSGEKNRAGQPYFEFGLSQYDQILTIGRRTLRIPVESGDSPVPLVEPGIRAQNDAGEWIEPPIYETRSAVPKDEASREYALIRGKSFGRVKEPEWYYFRLPFGRSVLAGGLTLMLVVLPIIIISSQEALRSIPGSLRDAGFGMGATRWQVVRTITLPAAIPGIMTGAILAISRAIGEAAPILILAGAIFITYSPGNLMDNFTVLPLPIYDWAGRPQKDFRDLAATGIIVLLSVLLVFNLAAVLIRQFTQKPLS